MTMNKNSDGSVSGGGVTTADGRNAPPLPSEFFTHPALTSVQGGAMTLLDKAGETGRGIPVLRADQLDRVGSFGRYAGPAVGVATALWDMVTADTLRKKACVATFSATAGIVGGDVTGGAALGTVSAPYVSPAAVPPWIYAGGTIGGTWTFGYVGALVGNVVCR